jgi:4'-phosphopantetheinyl transferase
LRPDLTISEVVDNLTSEDFVPRVADHALQLPTSELHVWSIPLDLPESDVSEASQVLSEDELSRAVRFHFALHRRRYIAGRSALRSILAAYVGKRAGDLKFFYGSHGKPHLALPDGGVRFNFSNSEGHAICAVMRDTEIGADLEMVRALSDYETIAEQFFSPGETKTLLSLPPGSRQEAFVNCWTRKEAFLKALGSGLALPLDSFEVSLRPGDPARLLSVGGNSAGASGWTLISMSPLPNFVASVAVRRQPRLIRTWTYQK